jgi:hypothetical protein
VSQPPLHQSDIRPQLGIAAAAHCLIGVVGATNLKRDLHSFPPPSMRLFECTVHFRTVANTYNAIPQRFRLGGGGFKIRCPMARISSVAKIVKFPKLAPETLEPFRR